MVLRVLAKHRTRVRFSLFAQTKINMFYKDIPADEIPDDIKIFYIHEVMPIKGELIIMDHEVVKLVDLIRDDKFDREWCVRLLHFPNSIRSHEVTDHSLVYCNIIRLRGFISNANYKKLVEDWEINEPYFPYSKDWSKEE